MQNDPGARKRIAISCVALFVLWIVVVLLAGAFNVASLALGLIVAALIVWVGERRRRRTAPGA